jgi:hypothetical protein
MSSKKELNIEDMDIKDILIICGVRTGSYISSSGVNIAAPFDGVLVLLKMEEKQSD